MIAENPFYYGSAENKLNSKGQVAIPARFRMAASEEDRVRNYVLTLGEDNCLFMYTHRHFARIKDNVRRIAEQNNDILFYRRFMAETYAVDLDTQGRFVVPQTLMREAGIKGPSLLFIGMDDRIEIWDPSHYNASSGDTAAFTQQRREKVRDIFGY